MSKLHELLDRVLEGDPDLLLFDDSYVLLCRECPVNLPELVAECRFNQLVSTLNALSRKERSTAHEHITRKLNEWFQQLDIDDDTKQKVYSSLSLIVRNEEGVTLAVSEQIMDLLNTANIDAKIFLTWLNDVLDAQADMGINESLSHVRVAHPGEVVCGGAIEFGGKLLCGASLTRVECTEDHPKQGLGNAIIMRSVRKNFGD